jgi:hypothetical protein
MEAEVPPATVRDWFNVWSKKRDGQLYMPPKWHRADDTNAKYLARRLTKQRFPAKISVAAVLMYIHVWNVRGLPQWHIEHCKSFFPLESASELRLLKNATAELPALIRASKVARVRMNSTMNATIRILFSCAIFFFSAAFALPLLIFQSCPENFLSSPR